MVAAPHCCPGAHPGFLVRWSAGLLRTNHFTAYYSVCIVKPHEPQTARRSFGRPTASGCARGCHHRPLTHVAAVALSGHRPPSTGKTFSLSLPTPATAVGTVTRTLDATHDPRGSIRDRQLALSDGTGHGLISPTALPRDASALEASACGRCSVA
ncbi:hypothetical protein L209DRAFT_246984 [Thermothelomyces heterothallicus CBS 203.75]